MTRQGGQDARRLGVATSLKLTLALIALAVFGAVALLGSKIHDPKYRTLVTVGPRVSLLIRNVRVFTGTGTIALETRQVRVQDGRITAIEPVTDRTPEGFEVIDGSGRTLLPGLIDFHVHVANSSAPPWYLSLPNPTHNLEAYLYAGVTTIVNMGDDVDEIGPLAAKVERGEIPGPRILFAGMPITRKHGHPQASVDSFVPWPLGYLIPRFSYEIETPADATTAVAVMKQGGASLVKMVVDDLPPGVPKLSPGLANAVVTAARQVNLKVAAHVGRADDAVLAARSGASVLNHGVHRGVLRPEQAEELASLGVPVSPTIAVFERCAELADGRIAFDELDREIEAKAVLDALAPQQIAKNRDSFAFLQPWLDEVSASKRHLGPNALTLHRAGVPIFVGTDSSVLGNIAGSSIHREMRLLSEAGIPAAEVLLGATKRPAAFLFEDPEVGTIEVGKRADLLLVEGNPLEDIKTTRKIVAVIKDGRRVDRSIASDL
ncbi:MAG: amidohydrolase family protein [Deltaproteobacteria bacterium]|nr:amidohydrolase family protein [Deltaproteobacteria bacterium]